MKKEHVPSLNTVNCERCSSWYVTNFYGFPQVKDGSCPYALYTPLCLRPVDPSHLTPVSEPAVKSSTPAPLLDMSTSTESYSVHEIDTGDVTDLFDRVGGIQDGQVIIGVILAVLVAGMCTMMWVNIYS